MLEEHQATREIRILMIARYILRNAHDAARCGGTSAFGEGIEAGLFILGGQQAGIQQITRVHPAGHVPDRLDLRRVTDDQSAPRQRKGGACNLGRGLARLVDD